MKTQNLDTFNSLCLENFSIWTKKGYYDRRLTFIKYSYHNKDLGTKACKIYIHLYIQALLQNIHILEIVSFGVVLEQATIDLQVTLIHKLQQKLILE